MENLGELYGKLGVRQREGGRFGKSEWEGLFREGVEWRFVMAHDIGLGAGGGTDGTNPRTEVIGAAKHAYTEGRKSNLMVREYSASDKAVARCFIGKKKIGIAIGYYDPELSAFLGLEP